MGGSIITETQNGLVCVTGDLKVHVFLCLCHGQRQHPLDQVAQTPVQSGLERFQEGRDIHYQSGAQGGVDLVGVNFSLPYR